MRPNDIKLEDLKHGDKLVADDGFTCLKDGEVCPVFGEGTDLFVHCSHGTHYLDGQLQEDGTIIGFKRA
jgi:hypothetical protein